MNSFQSGQTKRTANVDDDSGQVVGQMRTGTDEWDIQGVGETGTGTYKEWERRGLGHTRSGRDGDWDIRWTEKK